MQIQHYTTSVLAYCFEDLFYIFTLVLTQLGHSVGKVRNLLSLSTAVGILGVGTVNYSKIKAENQR